MMATWVLYFSVINKAIRQPCRMTKVYSVRMDSKNRLWVLCGENHIGYFNGSNFAFREVPVRLSKSSIKNSGAKLYIDYSGNIMLVFSGITWVTFNENSGEFAEKYNPFELPAKGKDSDR